MRGQAPLISIEQARRLAVARARRTEPEPVALADALGRVLAADAIAATDLPPFDSAGMDGYAVRAADTEDAPVALRLAGEARAGALAAAPLRPGTAIRVSTGAVVPAGADAVVRQELTALEDGAVIVERTVPAGSDIRRAGEDIAAGRTIVSAGTLLGAAEIGALAAADVARPLVAGRPRVALVSTGDELVEPGPPLRPGQIRDATAPALVAAATVAGAQVSACERVGDDRDATVAALRAALADVELLITVGGVSVGPHDHVRPALELLGAERVFCRVSLKPGGQLCLYATGGGTLAFALPGNPASALTAFAILVAPTIAAMLGRSVQRLAVRGIAAADLPGAPGRTAVVRCRAELRDDGWHVTPNGDQGSHVLTSMLGLPALALVPADRELVRAGEPVEIELGG